MIEFKDDEPAYQSRLLQRAAVPGDADRLRDLIVSAHDGSTPGGMWSLYDPDIVFHVPAELPYGGTFRGLENVRAAHAATRDFYDRILIEIEQIVCSGDLAFMIFQFNFRARKTGQTGRFPMIEMFRFRNGRVIEWRGYHFAPGVIASMLGGELGE
jgi:ketosteroid isomerase-like protein